MENTLNSAEISSILQEMTCEICHDLSLWLEAQNELGATELPIDDAICQPQVLTTAPVVPKPQPAAPTQSVKPTISAPKPAEQQPTAAPKVTTTPTMGFMQSFQAMRNMSSQAKQYHTTEERQIALEALNARTSSCRQCLLGNSRRGILCGYGPADASIMFVAAGGNPRELDKGRLMTDDAAALFDKIVAAMATLHPDAAPNRIYMTNLIKCAAVPPRDKCAEIARNCLNILRQEVRILAPKVIVVWGELALKSMFGNDLNISQARGVWQNFEGIPAIATHHPIEMLKNPKLKGRVWADLQAAVSKL
jgi:DNA polymerase